MNLNDAVEGALTTREALRSRQGIENPVFISKNMQRLAQYIGAIEEHLAEVEEELEVMLMERFTHYQKEGKSVNMSEQLARFECGELKGKIAKLSRYVNSSWKLISTSQSRFNHIAHQMRREE